MNNSDILVLTYELKDKIKESSFYLDLKEKEKSMLEDDECFKLLSEYQKVQEEYNEAKRFEKYGGKVEERLKELSEIKYRVDENELVKAYNLAYKTMVKELKKIEKIVFKDIIEERRKLVIEEE